VFLLRGLPTVACRRGEMFYSQSQPPPLSNSSTTSMDSDLIACACSPALWGKQSTGTVSCRRECGRGGSRGGENDGCEGENDVMAVLWWRGGEAWHEAVGATCGNGGCRCRNGDCKRHGGGAGGGGRNNSCKTGSDSAGNASDSAGSFGCRLKTVAI